MNQIDKLFRDHLEDHATEPSGQAWEKISNNLSNKKQYRTHLLMAAVISVPLLFATWFFLSDSKSINQLPAVTQKANTVLPEKADNHEELISDPEPIRSAIATQSKTAKRNPDLLKQEVMPAHEEVDVQIEITEPSFESPASLSAAPAPVESPTIHYSLADASRFKKLNKEPDATTDENKPSKLKSIYDAAVQIKNNPEELGGLRQLKDDVFAFNLKEKKTDETTIDK